MLEHIAHKIGNMVPFFVPNYFQNPSEIFSWQRLEELVNLTPFVNKNRFIIVNKKFGDITWNKRQSWSTDPTSYPPDIVKEILTNHMAYLMDASRASKGINQIAHELESITGCATDAHIFFAPHLEDTKGFGIHNDYSHNFIVQIEGHTLFNVWNIKENGNRETANLLPEDPIISLIMCPGDAVFIPARYWHQAITLTQRLSVSFPMTPDTAGPLNSRDWISFTER